MAIEPIMGFYVHDEATNTDGVAGVAGSAISGDIPGVNARFEGKADNTHWLDLEWVENHTILSDGRYYALNGVSATEKYYPVREGDVLSLYMYAPGQSDNIVLYDTAKNFVEYLRIRNVYSYTVPQDGYMRFSNEPNVIPNANTYARITNSAYMSIEEIQNGLANIDKIKTRNLWTAGDVSATGYKIIGTQGAEMLPAGTYTLSAIFHSDDQLLNLNVYAIAPPGQGNVFAKTIASNDNVQVFRFTSNYPIDRFMFAASSGSGSSVEIEVTSMMVETIEWSGYSASDSTDFTTLPYGTDYIAPTVSFSEKISETVSPWQGKKILYNGDSVTQGIYTPNGGARTGYVKVVNKMLKFGVVDNYAIGGTRLAHVDGEADCMVDRLSDMSTDADIVFIMANTNDYASQVPIGDADSTDISTYNGALNTLFTWLKTNYPQAPVIISTMLTRKVNYVSGTSTPLPITIDQYAQAVRDRVEDYRFILYDAYKWSGLDLKDSPQDGTGITNDGLHPNEVGAELLGRKIANFINNQ